jgi:hypothetical protein
MASKPKLKLGFTDYYPTMDDFFMDTLSKTFDIERNDASPDYLIFADETFGTNNRGFDPNKVTKIFFTGENRRPYNYEAHHAISFDHLDGPQFYRLPLYVLDNWVQSKNGVRNFLDDPESTPGYDDRPHFCGFVASNAGGSDRNKIFHMLNEYKPVLAGGPLFNNIGYVLPRDVKSKIDFLSTCRFSLCFENSSWPGYVTEKITHGFLAGTVPLYWGSPTVEMDFDDRTFISRHDFLNDNNFIDYIIKIDQDVDQWSGMAYRRPVDLDRYMKNWDLTKFNWWFLLNVYKGVRS